MEVIENKALLLRVRHPHRITSVIPKSKIVRQGRNADEVSEVLVRWGVEESQILKNIGIKKVPSPITVKYNWPGLFKPFDHQRETASFLTLHRRAYVFNEPGTGKTASVAWASDYLINKKYIKRVLIICPLSIMSSAWQADLFKTVMHRHVDVAHGDRKKRIKVIESDAEYVIINFDGVETVVDELKKAKFDLVVIDEANAVKTHTTKRWKAINSLITPDTWLWMMTGTPASQSPTDAYGLARMLRPSSVPPNFYSFRDTVMYKVTQFKWAPKPKSETIVNHVLQPAIRFTKEQCLDLPELLYTTRDVPLTPQQNKYYITLKEMFLMQASGETVTSVNAATNLNKLLQVSGGAVYTDDGNVLQFDITHRYNTLIEAIDESTHKVLVFVPFRHTIDLLYDRLVKDGYKTELVHGGVPVNQRTQIFNRFQTEADPRILLIQPAAASHGVTLHAANTVVWWGPVTSNEIYHQANARVHRAGQKNPCLVVRLSGSSVEKKLYKALDAKTEDMDSLLDLYKSEIS